MKLSTHSRLSICGSLVAAVSLLAAAPLVEAKDKPKSKAKATPVPEAVPAEPANAAPLPVATVSDAGTTITNGGAVQSTTVTRPTVPAPRADSPSGIQLGNEPIPVSRVPAVPSSGTKAPGTMPDSGGVIRSTGAGSGDASTRFSPGAATGVPSASGTASGLGTATTSDTPGGTGPNPSPAGTAVPGAPKAPGTAPVRNPGTRPIQ